MCLASYSCLGGPEKAKHQNVLDLYGDIDHKVGTSSFYSVLDTHCDSCVVHLPHPVLTLSQESKHRRTDRSVLCCLKKAVAGKSWPRLSKDKAKVIFCLYLFTKNPLHISGFSLSINSTLLLVGQTCLFRSPGSVLTSIIGKTGTRIPMKICQVSTNSLR